MADQHVERIRAASRAFHEATQEFLSALTACADAERATAEGGWSPAQIAWHIAQSNVLTSGMLNGTLPGSRPARPDFVEDPAVFSRIPERVEVPYDALKPPRSVSREDAVAKVRQAETATIAAIESLTPERARHTVKMPYGVINLYQVAEFVGVHTRRHHAQLIRTTR